MLNLTTPPNLHPQQQQQQQHRLSKDRAAPGSRSVGAQRSPAAAVPERRPITAAAAAALPVPPLAAAETEQQAAASTAGAKPAVAEWAPSDLDSGAAPGQQREAGHFGGHADRRVQQKLEVRNGVHSTWPDQQQRVWRRYECLAPSPRIPSIHSISSVGEMNRS